MKSIIIEIGPKYPEIESKGEFLSLLCGEASKKR